MREETAPQVGEAQGRRRGSSSSRIRFLRLVTAAGVLIALFTQVSFGEVAGTIAEARPLPLLAGLVLTLIAHWGMAWRFKRLTDAHGVELTTVQVLEINLGAQFYGLFLPGGNVTTLALRFYNLARAQQDTAGAGVSLLLDRVFATLGLCFVSAVFWLLERPPGTAAAIGIMAALFAATLLLARAVLARDPGPMLRRLRNLAGRVTVGKLAKFNTAVHSSRSLPPSTLALAGSISVGVHLIGVVVWYLTIVAVGVVPSIVSLGWIRSVVILVTMIPISIAGLGLREGAALVLLAPYGVSGEQAVAFSLLVFAVTVLAPGLVGGAFGGWRLVSGSAGRQDPPHGSRL